jgi:hypothetical protein
VPGLTQADRPGTVRPGRQQASGRRAGMTGCGQARASQGAARSRSKFSGARNVAIMS